MNYRVINRRSSRLRVAARMRALLLGDQPRRRQGAKQSVIVIGLPPQDLSSVLGTVIGVARRVGRGDARAAGTVRQDVTSGISRCRGQSNVISFGPSADFPTTLICRTGSSSGPMTQLFRPAA